MYRNMLQEAGLQANCGSDLPRGVLAHKIRTWRPCMGKSGVQSHTELWVRMGTLEIDVCCARCVLQSGPESLQALLPAEEVAELQKMPFAIIQASLVPTVQNIGSWSHPVWVNCYTTLQATMRVVD